MEKRASDMNPGTLATSTAAIIQGEKRVKSAMYPTSCSPVLMMVRCSCTSESGRDEASRRARVSLS